MYVLHCCRVCIILHLSVGVFVGKQEIQATKSRFWFISLFGAYMYVLATLVHSSEHFVLTLYSPNQGSLEWLLE